MFSRRPALRFVLLFAAGIFLSEWISPPYVWLFFLSVSLVLISVFLFRYEKQFCASIMLCCSIVLLGSLLHSLQRLDFESRKLTPGVDDESVTVFGIIDSEPVRQDRKIS